MSFLTATRCFFCFEWRIPFCYDFDLFFFLEINHVFKIEMIKKSDSSTQDFVKGGARYD